MFPTHDEPWRFRRKTSAWERHARLRSSGISAQRHDDGSLTQRMGQPKQPKGRGSLGAPSKTMSGPSSYRTPWMPKKPSGTSSHEKPFSSLLIVHGRSRYSFET